MDLASIPDAIMPTDRVDVSVDEAGLLILGSVTGLEGSQTNIALGPDGARKLGVALIHYLNALRGKERAA